MIFLYNFFKRCILLPIGIIVFISHMLFFGLIIIAIPYWFITGRSSWDDSYDLIGYSLETYKGHICKFAIPVSENYFNENTVDITYKCRCGKNKTSNVHRLSEAAQRYRNGL